MREELAAASTVPQVHVEKREGVAIGDPHWNLRSVMRQWEKLGFVFDDTFLEIAPELKAKLEGLTKKVDELEEQLNNKASDNDIDPCTVLTCLPSRRPIPARWKPRSANSKSSWKPRQAAMTTNAHTRC
jgi:hypothetical protein